MAKKLFVYVHQHLSTPQKAIQGMHAAVRLASVRGRFADVDPVEFYMAPLVFKNGGGTEWMERLSTELYLDNHNVEFSTWREDSITLGSLLTAIAIYMDEDAELPFELSQVLYSSGGLVRV